VRRCTPGSCASTRPARQSRDIKHAMKERMARAVPLRAPAGEGALGRVCSRMMSHGRDLGRAIVWALGAVPALLSLRRVCGRGQSYISAF
jgi:hypothetical protein